MPQKKFSFGITTQKGYLDLARFDPRKNGSFYLTPFPVYWEGTGFHTSFHPNGTYFKTYKPLNTVFVGKGLGFVNDIRNYFEQNTLTLNVQEEPGVVCLLSLDDPFHHLRLQKKNITIDGVSLMNSMGIAEVDNVKRSLDNLKQQRTFDKSLVLTYGMNTGTTSFILDSSSNQKKSAEARKYTEGLTIKSNLCDFHDLLQLPFVSPYIDPMKKIIEGAKEYLCRNNDGFTYLSELNPRLKLDV